MKIQFLMLLMAAIFIPLYGSLSLSTSDRGVEQHLRDRSVARLPEERTEPLSIRAVSVRGTKVSHRSKFKTDDNWLDGFAVTVKNRTKKPITFAAINLQFPRPFGSAGRIAVHTLEYGNPGLLVHRARIQDSAPRIAPGQTVDLALPPREANAVGLLLSSNGYHSPEKLLLSIGHVIFEDDTGWYAGSSVQRDPADSKSWINIEESAKNAPSTRGPVRDSLRNRNLDVRSATELVSFGSYARSPGVSSLFSPASFVTFPQSGCKAFSSHAYPGCGTYGWCGAECRRPTDYLSTSSGNYYLAQASSLCKRAACINETDPISCGTYGNSYIMNMCSSGGGGGGGGGMESSCFSSDECDFGFVCNQSGHCTGDFMPEENDY
jgi:hypothetical protein